MIKILPASRLRYGFELETQSFEDYGNDRDAELDDSEYDDWREERTREILGENCLQDLPSRRFRNLYQRTLDAIEETIPVELDEDGDDLDKDIADLFAGDSNPYLKDVIAHLRKNGDHSSLIEDIEEYVSDEVFAEDVPDHCYKSQRYGIAETLSDLSRCTHRFTCETDGTVRGPEIQSGICTLDGAKAAFRELRQFDFEVDVECSFHIHVSHNNVRHQYGERMQYLQMWYIWKNMHRVPLPVLERWQNEDWLAEYFNVAQTRKRYAFVAFRSDVGQGTWEYRCFGNVEYPDDADACLDLAQDAFLFASRRKKDYPMPTPNDFFLLKKNIIARANARYERKAA